MNANPVFVLASTSPYRRQLLVDFGLTFVAQAPKVDEDILKASHQSLAKGTPQSLCEFLARAKAESLVGEFGEAAFIIGSDQLVELDGEILGKPGNVERAVAQLMRMQGRKHKLLTAMSVFYQSREHRHTDVTVLKMRPLTESMARAYVDWEQPLDCAGSYKLEKAGRALLESVETADSSAIIGLPLIALTEMILKVGLQPPCLTTARGAPP